MNDVSAGRIDALERRLAALEDERAVRALVARYCYHADSRSDEALIGLFTPDGVLSSKADGASKATQGADALRAQIANAAGHQHPDVYGRGMHVLGLNLVVEVDGDAARASSYSLYVVKRDDGLAVTSASSNRWEFRRVDGAWRLAVRDRRPIADGDFAEVLLPVAR